MDAEILVARILARSPDEFFFRDLRSGFNNVSWNEIAALNTDIYLLLHVDGIKTAVQSMIGAGAPPATAVDIMIFSERLSELTGTLSDISLKLRNNSGEILMRVRMRDYR